MSAKSQPITSTIDPQQDRLLRRTDVEFIVGLGKTCIYAGVRAGTFPAPVHLTDRAVAWRKSEIDAWLASRMPTNQTASKPTVKTDTVAKPPSVKAAGRVPAAKRIRRAVTIGARKGSAHTSAAPVTSGRVAA